jgi:hypothetical protein
MAKRGRIKGPPGRPVGGTPRFKHYIKAPVEPGGPAIPHWHPIPEEALWRRLSPVGIPQHPRGSADWVVENIDLAVDEAESILFEYGFESSLRGVSDDPILGYEHLIHCDNSNKWWTMSLEPEIWQKISDPDVTVINFNSYDLTSGITDSDTKRLKKFLDDMGSAMKWAFAVIQYCYGINRRAIIKNGLDDSLAALLDTPEWTRFCSEIEHLRDPKLTRAIEGLRSVSGHEGRVCLHKKDIEMAADLGHEIGCLYGANKHEEIDERIIRRNEILKAWALELLSFDIINKDLGKKYIEYSKLARIIIEYTYPERKKTKSTRSIIYQYVSPEMEFIINQRGKELRELRLPKYNKNVTDILETLVHPNGWL